MINIREYNKNTDLDCACGKEPLIVLEGGEECHYCGNEIPLCRECFTKLTVDIREFSKKKVEELMQKIGQF